jgi:hypothetical protein
MIKMFMKRSFLWCAILTCAILALLFSAVTGKAAQEQPSLKLSMSRTFGYSSGSGQIQGTFTLKASGPQDLQRVIFYLDGESLGEVGQAPFELRFVTDTYPLGLHTLYVVGFTADGQELRSNEIRAEFVSAEEGWRAAVRFATPILVIVFGLLALSIVMSFATAGKLKQLPPGTPRSYGTAGGAICPRCKRPFARHIFSMNLVTGKLERCPFCGKWSIVSARSLAELRAAEEAELQTAQGVGGETAEDEGEHLRKELDESRYQDL